MAMLEEISKYLQDTGHGTVGTTIFMDILPESPDTVITLISLPGSEPLDHMGDPLPAAENLRLQVQVRSPSHVTAETISRSIYADLLRATGKTLTSATYYRIAATQSPFLSERDTDRRWIFVCSYNLLRKYQT